MVGCTVKKRICIVTTVPTTLRSFVLETAKYLYATGEFDITFISNYEEEFAKVLPAYINYYPIAMKRGINFDGLRCILEMYKIFKKEKFDLVQYSTPNASLYASVASFFSKIKVRLYCQWGIAYVGFDGLKRKIFKTIEKFVCMLSTNIQPDSYSNLHFAQREKLYNEKKGEVIWNGSACGINLDKFNYKNKEQWNNEIREKFSIDEKDFVFGFVGRINRDKGIDELFEAFKMLEKESSNIKLMLVGNEENIHLLNQDLYKWAKANSNIIFCGRQSQVEQYYSVINCYVLPSYREGFGMGVIEAESMGIPVIVSNIPGPTDAMKNNVTGLMCEKKNVEDLKNKMFMMLDEKLCTTFAENTREFVIENFEQNKFFEYVLENRKRLLKM